MSTATDGGEAASLRTPPRSPILANDHSDKRRHWSDSAANGAAKSNGSAKRNGIIAPIKIPENGEPASTPASATMNGVVKPASAKDGGDQPKRLPAEKLLELVSGAESIPIHVEDASVSPSTPNPPASLSNMLDQEQWQTVTKKGHARKKSGSTSQAFATVPEKAIRSPLTPVSPAVNASERPSMPARTASNPTVGKAKPASKTADKSPLPGSEQRPPKTTPLPLDIKDGPKERRRRKSEVMVPSPLPSKFPLPPMSLSTHLRLELSASDPSPLYIYRASNRDFPYEPSRVKLERLTNFLLLPPQLEQALWFGTLACLDSWLYTFTLLPLRFVRALCVLAISWGRNVVSEFHYLIAFIYGGVGRVWRRQQLAPPTTPVEEKSKGARLPETHAKQPLHSAQENEAPTNGKVVEPASTKSSSRHRHKRSEPSKLLPVEKADILKGLLIVTSCVILMYFDASMMYHSIRGQAAIKLYVIYNVLEVFDRLLAALGQDILECLFSPEALERHPNGRSKVLRPMGLFLLALIYNIAHSIALFYQVITLNVAVNSYSNALFTLLMSNQFVEIKSTVFKRFEKENLFQMTCADIVERFQLWLMLMIIASRNIIETNNIFGEGGNDGGSSFPLRAPSSILPFSFTILPSWVGQVMAPFFLVLGIEMLVDWVKHAYITKFNNTKPNIYGRFLDVLAKDYYTQAFAGQDLTKRLGLPLIPLSCLFIRASVQTYHMFLDTHLPLPLPSRATSLAAGPDPSQSPATTAAMLQLPQLLRRVLGRHVPAAAPAAPALLHLPFLPVALPSADTLLALLSTGVFFALLFALLLAAKLLLGMALLAYARRRYGSMKAREAASSSAEGRRIGGWGTVEVDEDKRRWIYDDDPEGLRKLQERDSRDREKAGKSLGSVERYSMVAKRIW